MRRELDKEDGKFNEKEVHSREPLMDSDSNALRISLSNDSKGNLFPRRSRPGYLTNLGPKMPKERAPRMDQPYFVDMDRCIYLDKHRHLCPKIEGWEDK